MSSKIPRLAYGFLSSSTDPINMKIPWRFSNQDGMFEMNYLVEDAMRDNLIFWAKCNKGEYIMDCNFGLDIRRYMFEPIEFLRDNVLQNAREQLPKYFPKFKVTKIDLLAEKDNQEISSNSVLFILEGNIVTTTIKNIKIQQEIGL